MVARKWLVRAAGFAVLVAAVGCSGGDSGVYATVSGTVTHNGSPVNGAKVNFHTTVESGDTKSDAYSATTDSNGKYLLASIGGKPGIPPGMYKVTITKLNAGSTNASSEIANDPGQMEASGAARNTLPKDYENLKTTKFSATLKEGENEGVDFDMKGKASTKGTAIGGTP